MQNAKKTEVLTGNGLAVGQITAQEFEYFRQTIYEKAGITLNDSKQTLVSGRLTRRLRHHGFNTFSQYIEYLKQGHDRKEQQMMVDLLTTNETYFFREPKHFDFLRERAFKQLGNRARPRVWSAASSTGEEPYTLAMLLSEFFGRGNWSMLATDISSRVLDVARKGVYPYDAINRIPNTYLQKYVLKGVRDQEGLVLMDQSLKSAVEFKSFNLLDNMAALGMFDIIFLRNVLIYFDVQTKKQVVERIVDQLKPGGYFMVGHSESLASVTNKVRLVQPAVYVKNS